jgi:hypothetical protein
VHDPADLAKVRAILEKYVGGGDYTTTALGTTSRDNGARDAGRNVAAQIAHTQTDAAGYRTFWDKKNAELRDSVRR